MPDLRSFIKALEREGELHKVDRAVSSRFEASAIMKEYDGKHALFFRRINDHEGVVAGICGTKKRLALSLNTTLDGLRPRIMDGIRNPQEPGVASSIQATEELSGLSRLPILTHFERDAASYITSAIVSVRLPRSREENVSIHRLMIID